MPQGLPAATTPQNPKRNKKSETHYSAARNRKDEHLKQTKITKTKP
jgi:hypothetical protein